MKKDTKVWIATAFLLIYKGAENEVKPGTLKSLTVGLIGFTLSAESGAASHEDITSALIPALISTTILLAMGGESELKPEEGFLARNEEIARLTLSQPPENIRSVREFLEDFVGSLSEEERERLVDLYDEDILPRASLFGLNGEVKH